MTSPVPLIELNIRLFGPFSARLNDTPLPPLRTRKGQWLLALLALRYDREVERTWLATTLWPESSESQSLYNLRRSLSDLRHALGNAADCIESSSFQTLRLCSERCHLDVRAFETALREAQSTECRVQSGKPTDSELSTSNSAFSTLHSALQTAVALYTGPLLEGCTEEWVVAERVAREQDYIGALEKLAQRAAQREDHAEVARTMRLALAVNPLHETALRLLMQAEANQGEVASALQAYRDYSLLLAREMNAQPAPETTALYQQIRAEARRQMSAPSVSRTALPGAELHGFPQPLTRFLGREEELEQIRRLLTENRLVTLTGTGGVGKTRLAIRAAEESVGHFEEGAWFADLSPLTTPTFLTQTLAAALRLREHPGQSLLQTLTDHLRAKRLLLVLDNCEHLVADCARIVHPLLQHCPQLHLLCTSRQTLGITGEVVFSVPSLPVPPTDNLNDLPESLEYLLQESPALHLFAERAIESLPSFRLTPQNLRPIAHICRHLDGLPLAIELTAARVRGLGVEQIAARLQDNLRLFTTGGPDRQPRHQTLYAAMDWSYALLSEEERALLRRLSIFSGGFTLEAVEGLCRKEETSPETYSSALETHLCDVLEPLLQLQEKSLLVYEERNGRGRYRLLETIRVYAAQKLTETEEAVLRQRHADLFLQLAEAAVPKLTGPDQAEWLERLDAEHDNLRAALAFTLSTQEATASKHQPPPTSHQSPALRLAAALWRFWFNRGHFSEGRHWLETALRENPAPSSARATALYGAGNLALQQGDYAIATGILHEALAVQESIGDKHGMALTLNSLGALAREQSDFDTARNLLEHSLAYLREDEDKRGLAHALGNLGSVALAQGDLERAQTLFEESIPLLRAQGAEQALALCLNNLAIIALGQERYEQARAYHRQGLEIHERLGDRQGIALALSNLAGVEAQAGNVAEAQEQFRQGLRLWQELGNKVGIAYSLTAMAQLCVAQEEMRKATLLFGASDALREAIQFPIPPVERGIYERSIEQAHTALGEAEFTATTTEGRLLTLEQALAYALAEK
jgi:predicted ATPase/DNA-binding SARP family transcriptional activator